MDVKEAVVEKEKLEFDLLTMVNSRLNLFIDKTGLFPSSVRFDFIDARVMGESGSERIVTSVHVEVWL